MAGAATVSSMVFHAPQAGHRPTHLVVSYPQDVQAKQVFSFATGLSPLFRNLIKTKPIVLYHRGKGDANANRPSCTTHVKMVQSLRGETLGITDCFGEP